MYKFQNVLKSVAISIFAVMLGSLFGVPRAYAASYTYSLANAPNLSGFITTNCDNCALNASNITAWSMTYSGFLSIASTVPGSKVSVPVGDTDMVATPAGITFNSGGSFGGIVFSDPSGSVSYVNGPGSIFYGNGAGDIGVCSKTATTPSGANCTYIGAGSSIFSIASTSVQFVGSVSYAFTGKVTSATGIYATAGATVSGTFTFDLNAGDGALPASFTNPWSSTSTGTSQLVASTLKSGSISFSDAGSISNKTTVAGLATAGSNAPNEYFASDTEFSSATKSTEHSFQIVGGTGAKAPFNSNGLPVFQNATGTGTLRATTGSAAVGQLIYSIISLTIAPTTVSVLPARLAFPDTLLNTQSAPLTVTITNTSPNDVTIREVVLDVVDSYKISANNCPEILGPKASCSVSIVFAPVLLGDDGGTEELIVADDAQGSPQTVFLSGTATALPAPVPTLTTTAVTFAGQQVGTTSAARAITLKNTGNAPLTIFSITLAPATSRDTDAFTLRNACVPTLEPGKACTVFVSFTPVVAGLASASVVISDNVIINQTTVGYMGQFGQSISVSGTGTTVPVPGLTLSASSLNFANQVIGTASVKHALNLTNTGTAPLNISSIALAGSHSSDFMLQNACASTLPAGEHCAVFFTFKPSTAGDLSAAVVVTSNAVGSESVATLYGTATAATAPVLTLSADFVGFSGQAGTTTPAFPINLTNSGTAPLSLSSIVIVGENGSQSYFTLRNHCVPVLAPGRLCTLFVTFNPGTAPGYIDATLIINDNAQGMQQSVQLEGVGPNPP